MLHFGVDGVVRSMLYLAEGGARGRGWHDEGHRRLPSEQSLRGAGQLCMHVHCMDQAWGWPYCWLPGHQHAACKPPEDAGVQELIRTDGCMSTEKRWWQANMGSMAQ